MLATARPSCFSLSQASGKCEIFNCDCNSEPLNMVRGELADETIRTLRRLTQTSVGFHHVVCVKHVLLTLLESGRRRSFVSRSDDKCVTRLVGEMTSLSAS